MSSLSRNLPRDLNREEAGPEFIWLTKKMDLKVNNNGGGVGDKMWHMAE